MVSKSEVDYVFEQSGDVGVFYLKEKRLFGVSARFDVVQVRFQQGYIPIVDIVSNAFEAQLP